MEKKISHFQHWRAREYFISIENGWPLFCLGYDNGNDEDRKNTTEKNLGENCKRIFVAFTTKNTLISFCFWPRDNYGIPCIDFDVCDKRKTSKKIAYLFSCWRLLYTAFGFFSLFVEFPFKLPLLWSLAFFIALYLWLSTLFVANDIKKGKKIQ